jgi:hypothetical protein
MGWVEYGFIPGSIAELPIHERRNLRRYYHLLNPQITWGEEKG